MMVMTGRGAAADRLRRIEGLKGAEDGPLIHPGAGIGDVDADVLARRHLRKIGGIGLVEYDSAGLDGELAVIRHGIAGI